MAGEVYIEQPDGTYKVMDAAQYDAEQMGGLEVFGQGFGRTMEQVSGGVIDALQGLGVMDNQASGITGETMRETMGLVQQDLSAEFAPIQQASPIAAGLGQAAPYLLTAPVGGATIGGQAALAATLGAVGTSGDVGERAFAGAISGAAGGAGAYVGQMAGRVFNATRQAYRPGIAGEFIEQGGRVTPGQISGNRALTTVENMLESAGGFGRLKDANQQLIQGQVSRAIGQDAVDLTQAGLGDAAEAIGGRFDEALSGTTVKMTDGMKNGIDRLKVDLEFLDLDDIGKTMTGEQYKQLRTQLGKLSRFEARNPSKAGKGDIVDDLIGQFDDSFTAAAGDEAAGLLGTAREQWRNLIAVEKGQAITPDGLVNPKSLNNALRNVWGKAARRGKYGRMNEATTEMMQGAGLQSAKQLGASVGDSGTATRLLMGAGLPAIAGGTTAMSGGNVGDAAMNAGLMYALMRGYGSKGLQQMLMGQSMGGAAGAGRAAAQGLMQ